MYKYIYIYSMAIVTLLISLRTKSHDHVSRLEGFFGSSLSPKPGSPSISGLGWGGPGFMRGFFCKAWLL